MSDISYINVSGIIKINDFCDRVKPNDEDYFSHVLLTCKSAVDDFIKHETMAKKLKITFAVGMSFDEIIFDYGDFDAKSQTIN